jgi:cytochrome c oxidase assembly protein subunit 15
MKATFRFALLTTILTYMLIFTGGLVRVSGAGLGCPDWPRCFGRWIPPTRIEQLPADVDPMQFNFTLAWIEYLNRLFGVLVGILVLITAILAVKYFRRIPRISISAVLVALLVAYTGWQGGRVVESELNAGVVSAHAVLAVMIAMMMIYVTQQIYFQLNPGEEIGGRYPAAAVKWFGIVWVISLVQIVLGTHVRGTAEAFWNSFPYARRLEWLSQAGSIEYLHMGSGLLIILLSLIFGLKILAGNFHPSSFIRQAIWSLLLIMAAQLGFGLVLLIAGMPPLLEVLHLWAAALAVGILLIVFSALKRGMQ